MSACPVEGGSVTVVEFFGGDGGEVVDSFVGALGVVPVHPFQGGGFDLVQVSPWSFGADEFGLVQADGGLGQGVDAPIFVKLPWAELQRRVAVA